MLKRVIRLLCGVPLITVPIQCSRIPLPPSQPEQRPYTWEYSNTKGSRCSVLILTSNFTSSGLSYWCFCPCAGAALEAECCRVAEGSASLGSHCASSRLQQESVHKPEQFPPKKNNKSNTALSTEPEREVVCGAAEVLLQNTKSIDGMMCAHLSDTFWLEQQGHVTTNALHGEYLLPWL